MNLSAEHIMGLAVDLDFNLTKDRTVAKSATVQQEGDREAKANNSSG